MKDSDHPYKRLFSHPRMIADLIRGFLDTNLTNASDLDTLTRCNGSYVTDDLREREDDIIWKVTYGEKTLIVYLLIEFQSKPDYSMPVRIMSYMALLWQDLIRTGIIVPSKPLPGIIPIVLYNGDTPWTVARDIKETIVVPEALARFIPSVPYLLIDELRLSVHHLIEVRNLAACLFGLEQSAGPNELVELGFRLNQWMESDTELTTMRKDFSLFFENTLKRDHDIPIPNPFLGGTMLAEKVNCWIAEYKAEGKEEGKVEGKEEGRIEGMTTILRRMKQTGMSVAEIARITGMPEDEIIHLI